MSIIVKSIKLSTHHVVLLVFFSCMPEAMPIMGQPTVDRIDDTHFFNISKYFIRTHPTGGPKTNMGVTRPSIESNKR